MEKVTSVSNLKASLSSYLGLVKSGEEILVTERGKPIARLVPYASHPAEDESRMERLYREGVIRPASGQSARDLVRGLTPVRSNSSVVAALLDERGSGW